MEEIEKAIQLKAELDALRPIDKEQEAIIMQKFRLDWNYHSNHLEGNSLSYGETKALILFGITAQGKPLQDHFEMTGHDEAIKWVEDIVKGDAELTEYFIRQLHQLLLKESREVDAITPEGAPTKKRIMVGQYKTTPNHVKTVTGEIFRFSTPEETPAQMHDLLEWYRQKTEQPDFNPITTAGEFHYRFIRIHPFDDGNGRTARILMNFILMRYGFPPVIIRFEDKENYLAVLRLADAGTITPFINYISQNLERSLEIMIAGAKGESIEEPDDLDKEIALLEQKLKASTKKFEKPKSLDLILKIYDNTVKRLCKEFINTCEKFNRFYLKGHLDILINQSYTIDHSKEDIFVKNRERLIENKDIFDLTLRYQYSNLKYQNLTDYTYNSEIKFNFKSFSYICELPYEKKVFEKSYDEQLTDLEIKQLINLEFKRHTTFMDEKIKEIDIKKQ
jgi:Fic family protein